MAIVLRFFKNPVIRWSMTIAWTILISIILVQPEQNPLIDTGIPPGPNTLEREIVFTTLHCIAFGLTCALWFWAWFGHLSLPKSLLMAVVFAIIIGSITEYLQTFSPDRYPSPIDFLANCTGTLLIAYVIWRKRNAIQLVNYL